MDTKRHKGSTEEQKPKAAAWLPVPRPKFDIKKNDQPMGKVRRAPSVSLLPVCVYCIMWYKHQRETGHARYRGRHDKRAVATQAADANNPRVCAASTPTCRLYIVRDRLVGVWSRECCMCICIEPHNCRNRTTTPVRVRVQQQRFVVSASRSEFSFKNCLL